MSKIELFEKAFSEISSKILDKDDSIVVFLNAKKNDDTISAIYQNDNNVVQDIIDSIDKEYNNDNADFTNGLASIVCPLAIELLARYSNLNVKFQNELLIKRQQFYDKARNYKPKEQLLN